MRQNLTNDVSRYSPFLQTPDALILTTHVPIAVYMIQLKLILQKFISTWLSSPKTIEVSNVSRPLSLNVKLRCNWQKNVTFKVHAT